MVNPSRLWSCSGDAFELLRNVDLRRCQGAAIAAVIGSPHNSHFDNRHAQNSGLTLPLIVGTHYGTNGTSMVANINTRARRLSQAAAWCAVSIGAGSGIGFLTEAVRLSIS